MKFFLFICYVISTISIENYKNEIKKNDCELLSQEWEKNKMELIKKTSIFNQGSLLNKNELIKIIIPEYVTYNKSQNILECGIIKYYFFLNDLRYNTISIGPFQMQLSFIKKILSNASNEELKIPLLINCKNNSDDYLINHLAELSEIDTQWNILLQYEKFCIKNKILRERIDINRVISYYNSGFTKTKYKFFNKIRCKSMSYVEWSEYLFQL